MKIIFTLWSIAFTCTVFGQSKIHGHVHDKNGDAVPGANVFILDTFDGATSDVNGSFEFTSEEKGAHTLVVRFVGYEEFRQLIQLPGEHAVDVSLKESINELEAVTISAGAFTASDALRRTVFKPLDIATTAGATADIAGALNTLPGTQKVGESGRLFVRGGDGNETRTFIDGMVVLDAYGPSAPNTPSRGRFLPFMFKGTSFSTGGYSAEYGQALSSALALDSKDQSEMTRTDIGILSVGGDVAHTQSWNGGSAAGKIQYTNIRPYYGLINQRIDWKTAPASIEGVGAFRQQIGKQGMLKLYGNFNHSSFSLYNHDIDNPSEKSLYDLTNRYRYVNASYKDVLNKNWTVRGGLSYTYQGNDARAAADRLDEVERGIHAKTVFEGSLSDKLEIKTGAEVIQRSYAQRYTPQNDAHYTLKFDEVITASFAEAELLTSNNFIVRGGVRAEYDKLINTFSADPRFSAAYKTSKSSQVSFAYGKFRQSPKNNYLRINDQLASEKAQHYILSYQWMPNDRTFRVETYYKKYDNLVKYLSADGLNLDNSGNGYAKGFELFWRDNKSVRGVDYWVSYSYLDTKRNYINFPSSAVPSFASRHNFSVVGKYFIQSMKSQVGATFSYASGRPYNNPQQERFNASRTKSYQDLSFNWSYLPKPYLIIYFSCTNVLGRDNVFGYQYGTQLNDQGMYNRVAVKQPALRFMFVGIFITLSKDKSVNQLPSL
jgi:hypothetical protein